MADGSFPIVAYPPGMPGKVKVVGFAGGGGSSEAIRLALNCDPDVAMNHWLTAVLAHQRHFPNTDHYCADIFDVDCRTVRPGERIAFGWFSPDCTDFSKAKGKAPRSERIRGLAWSVIPWALFRRVGVIMLENVEEFAQWGPVYRDGPKVGEPIPERRGETFRRWKSRLEKLGYVVEWRVLNAADYGAPTTRKRLYLIARCDGQPIVWPEPTHAPRHKAAELGLKPWRGACEIIDWSQDCPSLFLTPEEVEDLRKRTGRRVQRPLVKATLKRVARGMERYVIGAAEPFIVPITQRGWGGDRAHGVRDPMRTIMSSKGGEYAVADAALVASTAHGPEDRAWPVQEPLRTATEKADKALVTGSVVKFQENSSFTDPQEPLHTVMAGAPRHGVVTSHLVGLAHGEHEARPGARSRDIRDPMQTVSAGGGDAALVGGVLVRTNFHSAAARNGIRDVQEPSATSTGDGGIGLASATLVPRYGEREGQAPRCLDIAEPVPTVVPDGNQGMLAAATLTRQFGTSTAADIREPAGAVMPEGAGKTGFVSAYMAQGNFGMLGRCCDDPVTTLTSRATQQQLISASLDSYYSSGSVGADPAEPMRTSTGKARHSLIAAWLEQANTDMVGHELPAPVSTIVGKGCTQRLVEARLELDGGAVGRRAAVLEFLWSHFGVPTADEWASPAATLQARLKFGLVLIRGQVWMIVDIGLRMLTPAELGAAMGLPADFDLTVDVHGNPISKTNQTQMIGNMVSPPPAAALIRANCPDLIEQPQERRAA